MIIAIFLHCFNCNEKGLNGNEALTSAMEVQGSISWAIMRTGS